MHRKIIFLFVLLITYGAKGQIYVDDFYTAEDEEDWSIAINKALKELDKIGHGSIEFSGNKTYTILNSIELPKESLVGKRIIVLEGNGCVISCKQKIAVFKRKAVNQNEALNKMMKTRFYFNDFTIKGGSIAIELDASYGSSIRECNFLGQKEAAVFIRFGLNTIISHCHSNGAWKDNFVLSSGKQWGGTDNNSQSNHSIIESCRVFARKGSNSAFKIIGSGGCVIRDCISEGSNEINYAIFIDEEKSNTVRLNRIENFHLEHKVSIAGAYLNTKGIITVDGLFYQKGYNGFVLIKSGIRSEQITLMNIPHYFSGSIIRQEKTGSGTAWKLLYCHKSFYNPENWEIKIDDFNYKNALPNYFSGEGYRYQIEKNDY